MTTANAIASEDQRVPRVFGCENVVESGFCQPRVVNGGVSCSVIS